MTRNVHITAGTLAGGAVVRERSPAADDGLAPDFALALERHGSGAAVLVLIGELDLYRAPEVEDALAKLIGPEPDSAPSKPTLGGRPSDDGRSPGGDVPRVAVDLRSVTLVDSTTLALLLAASRRQHARGSDLLVLVGPQTPMTAFEVTGFDRLLAIRRVDDDIRESAA